jgi:hypothetical protein
LDMLNMAAVCALLLNLSAICSMRLRSCGIMSHHGTNAKYSSVIWRDSTFVYRVMSKLIGCLPYGKVGFLLDVGMDIIFASFHVFGK